MSEEFKETCRTKASSCGFEFFGVVDATELARVQLPPHRGLRSPHSLLVEARSVIILGMYVWDPLFNAVITSVIPGGIDSLDSEDVPGAQYYNFYYAITESQAHRFSQTLRDAGYEVIVTHSVHQKAAAALAGLGWIGKQTLCITPLLGPRVRWCAVITDAILPYDTPFTDDLCGDCELCVRSCPVGAIIPGPSQGVDPGKKVDCQKCIILQERLAEPNEHWRKYARKFTRRGFTECLICHDACPIGREEHVKRVTRYGAEPTA